MGLVALKLLLSSHVAREITTLKMESEVINIGLNLRWPISCVREENREVMESDVFIFRYFCGGNCSKKI